MSRQRATTLFFCSSLAVGLVATWLALRPAEEALEPMPLVFALSPGSAARELPDGLEPGNGEVAFARALDDGPTRSIRGVVGDAHGARGLVRVRVTDRAGEGLLGCVVHVYRGSSLIQAGSTDERGCWTREVAVGSARVTIDRSSEWKDCTISSTRPTNLSWEVDGLDVEVLALDASEQAPLAGASVWLSDDVASASGSLVGETDAEGVLRLRGLRATQRLFVTRSGYAPSAVYRVKEGGAQSAVVHLTEGGACMSVLAVDDRGAAVAGALVGVELVGLGLGESPAVTPGPEVHLVTDRSGRAALCGIWDREQYRVSARAAGYAEQTVLAETSSGRAPEVVLQLSEEAVVFGSVLDACGDPFVACTVRARPASGRSAITATTDDRGHYVLRGLPDGLVDLSVRSCQNNRAEAPGVAVESGGARRVDFELSRGSNVHGRVVDASSGEPCEGVLILMESGEERATVRTDASGAFSLQTVGKTVTLTVLDVASGAATPAAVVADRDVRDGPIEIEIDRTTCSIRGVAFPPAGSQCLVELFDEQLGVVRESVVHGEFEFSGLKRGRHAVLLTSQGKPRWVRWLDCAGDVDLGVIDPEPVGALLVDGLGAADEYSVVFVDRSLRRPVGSVSPTEDSLELSPGVYEVICAATDAIVGTVTIESGRVTRIAVGR